MIIYNKLTGDIVAISSDDKQTIEGLYFHYPNEFKESLEALYEEFENPAHVREYRIVKGKIVKRPEQEIQELNLYGKILTQQERDDIANMPPAEEAQKARQTLELVEILEELSIIDTETVQNRLVNAYSTLVLAKQIQPDKVPLTLSKEVDKAVKDKKKPIIGDIGKKDP